MDLRVTFLLAGTCTCSNSHLATPSLTNLRPKMWQEVDLQNQEGREGLYQTCLVDSPSAHRALQLIACSNICWTCSSVDTFRLISFRVLFPPYSATPYTAARPNSASPVIDSTPNSVPTSLHISLGEVRVPRSSRSSNTCSAEPASPPSFSLLLVAPSDLRLPICSVYACRSAISWHRKIIFQSSLSPYDLVSSPATTSL